MKVIFWGAAGWLFVAGLLALQFWPQVPHSVGGWVAFVVFVPPLYVLAEGAVEAFWSSRYGRALSHPSPTMRLVIAAAIVAFGCIFVWAIWWLRSH